MFQTTEGISPSEGPKRSHGGMEFQGVPSQMVIPAVPGEYYAYSSEFTEEQPLYALMKCKANKARSIADAEDLGDEVNLLFLFGSPIQVCAVGAAHASGLLGDSVNGELFGETWITPAGITAEDFYGLRSRKDVETLVKICRTACSEREVSIVLDPGAVIAMMTDGGKYGLFFVKGLAPTSIQIDACHILL